jgi:DNA-binding SARP family transcriptional activator
MARLSLRLFGPFHAALDGEPITAFKSDKVRALLAYLVTESGRPHPREKLAGLLWPEWTERDARGRLRRVLSSLRLAIGDHDATPSFLLVTRQTIQFNALSNAGADVTTFEGLAEAKGDLQQMITQLEEAVCLYRGDFLEGFSIADSGVFEEWALLNRERFRRMLMLGLGRLVGCHEQRGDYERALPYAWRLVEIDPWREKAHRQLMQLLALSGERGAALAQYETCRLLLAQELGVEPGDETTRLYEEIRDGRRAAASAAAASAPIGPTQLPPFLLEVPPQVERPVFVARGRELAQLEQSLDLALAGKGRVVFVTGEAGSGKTSLVREFTRRAQETHPDLIVAGGYCNAYTGAGDPYLPFRHILELLTGDIEASWGAGAITKDHALRLWNTLPITARALIEFGPDLVGSLVASAALVERARCQLSGQADWLTKLEKLLERSSPGSDVPSPQQVALFEQCSRVLRAVAAQAPLVLILDDLQWADAGSIHLLFHLGRQLAGSPILIVGIYRPEDVAVARAGERHPLQLVVNEFQRDFGRIGVDLSQAEGREFVDALLDSEPNRLGGAFRDRLYRQTHGHPLFAVELLRGLQERADLGLDHEGRWIEGPALDWDTLPARVEAVIAERVGRLTQPLQATLRVASVEGEVFTAEVAARVQGIGDREMLTRLSSELDRRHRLIRAQSISRTDGRLLSRYRFRHIMFQSYLYGTLDEVERAHLHQQVGSTMEQLYQDEASGPVAVDLARHFGEAGIVDKAIHYLHQAGRRAMWLSAYQEAIAHLTRGLALLTSMPGAGAQAHRSERAERELSLQLALGMAWTGGKGTQAPEVRDAYSRALELCRQTGNRSQLWQVLGELSVHYYVRAEHQRAREMAEEALCLALEVADPLLVAVGHWYAGVVLLALGEYATARTHLRQTISFYRPRHHHRALVALRGSDVGASALAYDACCLWCLGYPSRGLERSREALALARELGHPFTLADVLCYAGCIFNELRQDSNELKRNAEELARTSNETLGAWSSAALTYLGGAQSRMGRIEEGIAQLREGTAAAECLGVRCYRSGALRALAEAQVGAGHVDDAMTTLAEALAFVEETDERHWEAELHRHKGESLLAQGHQDDAEACLHKAIDVARSQSAKSWELRSTVSLSRLWQQQGKHEHARQCLAEIYGWFTEGFDTTDLIEAKVLLDELSA